jgi:uncharacterized OB-fold protein
MSHTYAKPIPNLDDPDMRPFWRALRERRLTAQRCGHCAALRFPALPICDTCLEEESEWVDVTQTGTIWSFVVYHRAFHPGFKDELPYAVAIVETDDGPRYTGTVVGPLPEVAIGRRVHAIFEDATPEFTMLKWVVDPAEPALTP